MISATTGYAAASIDDLPTLWDGFARLVRDGLGITAFGAKIMDLPPDYTTESHDESDSGQQELYVALRGSGFVDTDGARLPLDADHLVRVDAGTARALSWEADGLRVLWHRQHSRGGVRAAALEHRRAVIVGRRRRRIGEPLDRAALVQSGDGGN
jgi:hypothetical protein